MARVHREEGFRRLFSGATTATGRGFLMTIGQIAFYDQVKLMLLATGYFKDDPRLHFLSSLAAGAIATTLTQPLDVIICLISYKQSENESERSVMSILLSL